MKRLITILTLLIAASTLSAQPTNPFMPKSRTHERETLSTHERTLPNGKVIRDVKAEVGKAATGKDSKNAALRLDSMIAKYYKYFFEYDNMGRTIAFENWDRLDNLCQLRYEYRYNTQGDNNQSLLYYWEESQFVLSEKEEYTYDDNGNLILCIRDIWDNDISQWIGERKWEYEYDAQGRQTLYISYVWNNDINQWIRNWKYEREYDVQGYEIIVASYHWESDLNDWLSQSRNEYQWEYQFDGNQRITQAIAVSYYGYFIKYEYAYDAQGNQIMRTYYTWENDGFWESKIKDEWTYDMQKNITMHNWYSWNNELNVWVKRSIYEYTHDLSYHKADVIGADITNFTDMDGFNTLDENIVLEIKESYRENITSDWSEPRIYTFHYSEITTSITTHPQHNISIYPNPTSGELRIENGELRMASVEVFDIMGRKQYAEIRESNGGVLLNISHLPPGIYLVKAAGSVWKVVKN
jgi:hypothetical protein